MPGGIGPSSTLGTQSATDKRGVHVCKKNLLKTPFSWLLIFATFLLSEKSRILDAKSRQKSANLG